MRRNQVRVQWKAAPAVGVAAGAFTIGVICGSLLARQAQPDGLTEYLSGYLTAVQSGQWEPNWLEVAWKCLRLPMLAFLLGFTPLGLIGIPVLLWGQGVTLSFAVAAFLRCYGLAGMLPAMAVFGVTGLVSIPALLLISAQRWRDAGARLDPSHGGRSASEERQNKTWLSLGGLCAVAHILTEGYLVLPLLAVAIEKM